MCNGQQQLLLRALVAGFWDNPYQAPVTRWGTELHDRFLLPYFVQHDFSDVLTEMGQADFHFDPAWFAPHHEFRFPLVGNLETQGLRLELRSALDPWHVMGEEGRGGGMGLVLAVWVREEELGVKRVCCLTFGVGFFAKRGFEEISDVPVDEATFAEMVRSNDDGVAEFLDLARVKQNTLGNTRMLKVL